VEEVLRHRPIVPGLTRVATEDLELASRPVEAGECLTMSFMAANRDPAHFDAPDVFDIAREGADAHVTFGWGPHFCLGAGLARLELTEALRALTARFGPPVLEVEPGPAPSGFGDAGDHLLVRFDER
jgi:cytochrome P450